MAHYSALYIGDPDNIYNADLNLFDDDEGGSGELADYGHVIEGLYTNHFVSTATAKDIDWKKSYSVCCIYREDIKERFVGNDGIGFPDYNSIDEMLQYIKPTDQCTMLNIHL